MKKKIIIISLSLLIVIVSVVLIRINLNKKENKITEQIVEDNSQENEKDSNDIEQEVAVDYLEFTEGPASSYEEIEAEFDESNSSINDSEVIQDPEDKPENTSGNQKTDPNVIPDYVTFDENGKMIIDFSDGDNKTPLIGE